MANDAQFLEPSGAVYTVPIDALSLTAESDLYCITASTSTKLLLREVRLGQYSEFGDAQAELLPIRIITGSTNVSGGSTVAAQNVAQHTGAKTAESEALSPSATLASTASATLRYSDSWNVAAGWVYAPLPAERLVVQEGETVVVRIGAPADVLTLNGTLIMQEIGS